MTLTPTRHTSNSPAGEFLETQETTKDATTTLAECEQVIRRGLLESSAALRRIREERLFREAGYPNFDTYCRDRLGIGRDMADRTIAAGAVLAELPTNVSSTLNEAHARALAPLRDDPAAMVEVLEEVTSTGKVTAARIAEKVAERIGRVALPAGPAALGAPSLCRRIWPSTGSSTTSRWATRSRSPRASPASAC